MPMGEEDSRSTEEKFIIGIANIRAAFRNHPQLEGYSEDLVLRIIKSFGRIKAGENDLVNAA